MTEILLEYDKYITRIWQQYDRSMTNIWQEYDLHMKHAYCLAMIWQIYNKDMTAIWQEYDKYVIRICQIMIGVWQIWQKYDWIMTGVWQIYDKNMTRIWQEYKKYMTRIWQNYDRSMTNIWQEYDLHMKHAYCLAMMQVLAVQHIVVPAVGILECLVVPLAAPRCSKDLKLQQHHTNTLTSTHKTRQCDWQTKEITSIWQKVW